MSEESANQPVDRGGPCDGGDGYAACNMVLGYECTQCGRREAADGSDKAPDEQETRSLHSLVRPWGSFLSEQLHKWKAGEIECGCRDASHHGNRTLRQLMNAAAKAYLAAIGRRGGKAGKGSAAKAASAKKANAARWKKHRATKRVTAKPNVQITD